MNEETLLALKIKHPEPPLDLQFPEVQVAQKPPDITIEELQRALHSFPARSGVGPDGLRPQHLKDLAGVPGETGANFFAALCKAANVIMSGDVHGQIANVLFGANLTPLLKKDGGIRPIASGAVLRRLVGKIISRRVQERLGEPFRPVQLGYGTKGGCEIAVHATRAFLEKGTDDIKCLLKLDFKNAFNTIRRDRLLDNVKEIIPEYLPYINRAH